MLNKAKKRALHNQGKKGKKGSKRRNKSLNLKPLVSPSGQFSTSELELDTPCSDQLIALRGGLVEKSAEFDTELESFAKDAYDIARKLSLDRREWEIFCRHSDWLNVKRGRPKPDDNTEVLKFALRFGAGFSDTALQKEVDAYCKGLSGLFQAGLDGDEAFAKVRTVGGIGSAAIRYPMTSSEIIRPDQGLVFKVPDEQQGDKLRKAAASGKGLKAKFTISTDDAGNHTVEFKKVNEA